MVENYNGGGGVADKGDFINVVSVDGVLDQGSWTENGQLETVEIEVVGLAEKIGVADGVNESTTMGGGHACMIPMHAGGCFRIRMEMSKAWEMGSNPNGQAMSKIEGEERHGYDGCREWWNIGMKNGYESWCGGWVL